MLSDNFIKIASERSRSKNTHALNCVANNSSPSAFKKSYKRNLTRFGNLSNESRDATDG
jgi:hypothetical protein